MNIPVKGNSTRVCKFCRNELPIQKFITWVSKDGSQRSIRRECKDCFLLKLCAKQKVRYHSLSNEEKFVKNKQERVAYKKKSPNKLYFLNVKRNAKARGLSFELTKEDFENLPTHCPILGIPIKFNEGVPQDNSISIDRIDNTKGYVKGNVVFISYKANRWKNSMSFNDIEKIYLFYKELNV